MGDNTHGVLSALFWMTITPTDYAIQTDPLRYFFRAIYPDAPTNPSPSDQILRGAMLHVRGLSTQGANGTTPMFGSASLNPGGLPTTSFTSLLEFGPLSEPAFVVEVFAGDGSGGSAFSWSTNGGTERPPRYDLSRSGSGHYLGITGTSSTLARGTTLPTVDAITSVDVYGMYQFIILAISESIAVPIMFAWII
jgi:hypothetical protein